ncbi:MULTISPECIES: DUF4328 domain-containing protein [Corallococcus]|uniref:DUF4328 domain-containing protein n=1 Tax=Corallococcus TaxID=83461 RepID=UPI001377CF73|nr:MULTISPECIES: DUF4328 domain-containing protein [Corallococcus]NBD12258.1 DUF4328 domain-containing protein [Corallococcus silvisoli]
MRLSVLAVPDSRARARWTLRLLEVAAGVSLLKVPLFFWVFIALEESGRVPGPLVDGVTYLSLLFALAAQVGFLMWVHRVVRQLKAQGADLETTPAMAVWMWLIPLLNWVKPYQLMKDIAEKAGGAHFAASLPLSLWWGANLLARVLEQVDQRVVRKMGTVEGVPSSASLVFAIFMSLCSAGTALACVQIVKALQARMDQRREGLEGVDTPIAEDEATAA